MRKFKNIEEFKNEFISDVNLQNEFKENPEQFVKQISTRKTLLDKKIFSYVIFFVAIVLIITLSACIVFIFKFPKDPMPTFLVSVASTSLGALVGLLTPSSK